MGLFTVLQCGPTVLSLLTGKYARLKASHAALALIYVICCIILNEITLFYIHAMIKAASFFHGKKSRLVRYTRKACEFFYKEHLIWRIQSALKEFATFTLISCTHQ